MPIALLPAEQQIRRIALRRVPGNARCGKAARCSENAARVANPEHKASEEPSLKIEASDVCVGAAEAREPAASFEDCPDGSYEQTSGTGVAGQSHAGSKA